MRNEDCILTNKDIAPPKSLLTPDLQKVEVVLCAQKLLHLASSAVQLSDFQLQF